MSAFNFDLIDAAGYGYHRIWAERRYLMRLALIPLILKFACAVMAHSLGYTEDFLRRGLIMLPSVFAEGWVLAQFLRTILMGERWPMPLPERGDEAAFARVILRARGIISSTLVYVLISLASTVLAWGAFEMNGLTEAMVDQQQASVPTPTEGSPAPAGGNPLLFIPAVAALLLSIWSLRLLWVYIPYVVLMPARTYLQKLGGFMASIRLAGLFLICMVPINVLAVMLVQGLISPYGKSLADAPDYISFAVILIGAVTDLIVGMLVTAAMAYALRAIVPHHPDELKDVSGKKS